MHADRTNRTALILFALVLIAIGVIGALTGFGAFGATAQQAYLFANPVGDYVGRQGAWLWLVIAAITVVVVLLALRWLMVLLFSTDRAGDLRITAGDSAERTTLLPAALTDAVAEEIENYPGVHSARARLIGDSSAPDLVIETTVEHTADPGALRRRIEHNAVAHARQALQDPELPVKLDLSIDDRRTSRVS